MYPQAFLKNYWQMELRPQIFVAMDFGEQYKPRFENIIRPAIRSIKVNGVQLEPNRVDLSTSGDSILTDITDGIAHSQMFLADLSSVGKDSTTGRPYRNSNVMYEVGIALACRQPSEVLLIRDDRDEFLFDVSTIPHMNIDFTNTDSAIQNLRDALRARLKERNHVNDSRVTLAINSLSNDEAALLKEIIVLPPDTVWGKPAKGLGAISTIASVARLLDKKLIRLVGEFEEGHPAYYLTPLGRVVAQFVKSNLVQFKADPKLVDATADEAKIAS